MSWEMPRLWTLTLANARVVGNYSQRTGHITRLGSGRWGEVGGQSLTGKQKTSQVEIMSTGEI